MALTPRGWQQFAGLTRERAAGKDPAALARVEAQIQAKRAEFRSEAWRHEGGISRRAYGTYDDYVAHQKEKLDNIGGEAFVNPAKAVNMFWRRFELVAELPRDASILCLGARRGEEVKALIGLGHFAIGLDLNPGQNNEYVVTGDFHALQFADASVDCVYMNCLDHAFELDKILKEIGRVLKARGLFIADLLYGYDEGFAVGNHDTMHWAKARDFAEHLARVSGFRIETFRDLAPHGSAFWTQCVMRKP
jgi:SAM-dependent methyltransferase